MSVQSATNTTHGIPWQYLQSLLGTGAATQQASGGKQASTAFDPFKKRLKIAWDEKLKGLPRS